MYSFTYITGWTTVWAVGSLRLESMMWRVAPINLSRSVGICVKKWWLRSLTRGIKFTALERNLSQEHSQILQYNLKEYKACTSKAIPNDCTTCQVQLQGRNLLNVLPDTLWSPVLQTVTLQLQCFFFKVKTLNHKNIALTPKGPASEMGLSLCQQQNMSSSATNGQECHDSSPHMQGALWVWSVRKKELVKKCQRLTPTHHTSMFVHLVRNMHTSWAPTPRCFTANNHVSHMPKLRLPYYHSVITPLSPSAGQHVLLCYFVSPSTHISRRCLPFFLLNSAMRAHVLTWTCWLISTALNHWGCTPTTVTFNGHSPSPKLNHTYKHSPTQRTMLCVKRPDPDGSHLVCADGLLRWLRTGYGHTHRWRPTESGREMDVLAIDLLRSMLHNLVIWHWESCTHWAGTVAWQTSLHLCRGQVN